MRAIPGADFMETSQTPPSSPPPAAPAPAAVTEGAGPKPSPSAPPPSEAAAPRRGRPKGVKNGAGKRRQAKIIRDKGIRELREAVALTMAVAGKRSDEIAESLGISRRLAQEILQESKRSEIFQRARDWIGEQLLPKVLMNVEKLLDEGDKETTLKMLERMALVGSGEAKTLSPWGAPAPGPSGPVIEETFEAFRLRVSRPVDGANPDATNHPGGAPPRPLIEGELLAEAPKAPEGA